jgi:hypothetical protein
VIATRNGTINGHGNVANISAGVEDPGGQSALALGKPFGDGLDAGGEVGGLAQAEEKHGDRERDDGKRRARQHGRDAPQADGDGERLARAELVGEPAGHHHADGVGRRESSQDVTVLDAVEAGNLGFKEFFKIGDHAAVDVRDDRSQKQQEADDPALMRDAIGGAKGRKKTARLGSCLRHSVRLLRRLRGPTNYTGQPDWRAARAHFHSFSAAADEQRMER